MYLVATPMTFLSRWLLHLYISSLGLFPVLQFCHETGLLDNHSFIQLTFIDYTLYTKYCAHFLGNKDIASVAKCSWSPQRKRLLIQRGPWNRDIKEWKEHKLWGKFSALSLSHPAVWCPQVLKQPEPQFSLL